MSIVSSPPCESAPLSETTPIRCEEFKGGVHQGIKSVLDSAGGERITVETFCSRKSRAVMTSTSITVSGKAEESQPQQQEAAVAPCMVSALSSSTLSPSTSRTASPSSCGESHESVLDCCERCRMMTTTTTITTNVVEVAAAAAEAPIEEEEEDVGKEWRRLCRLVQRRRYYALTTLGQDRLVLCGGQDPMYETCLNTLAVYDVYRGTWTYHKMQVRRKSCAAVTVGQCVYLFGGASHGGGALNSCEKIDFSSPQPKSVLLPPMKERREGCAAVTILNDGFIAVIGGTHGGNALRTMEILDLKRHTWSRQKVPKLNAGRCFFAAVSNHPHVIVAGGYQGRPGAAGKECACWKKLVSCEVLDMRNTQWKQGWQELTDMRSPRYHCGAVAVLPLSLPTITTTKTLETTTTPGSSSFFFVVAGGVDMTTVDAFDFASKTWTYLPPLLEMSPHHNVAVLGNNMLVATGEKSIEFLPLQQQSDTDPSAVAVRLPPIPTQVACGSSTSPPTAVVLPPISTRCCPQMKTNIRFAKEWRSLTSLPTRRLHYGVASIGTRFLAVVGGYDPLVGTFEDSVDLWDFHDQEWSSITMREKRRLCSAVAVGCRIFVFGGDNSAHHRLATCEMIDLFDPLRESRELPPMRHERRGCTAVAVDDGKYIVVLGGYDDEHDNHVHSTVEVFDVERMEWREPGPCMLEKRCYQAAASAAGSCILVAGGYVENTLLSSAEMWDIHHSVVEHHNHSHIQQQKTEWQPFAPMKMPRCHCGGAVIASSDGSSFTFVVAGSGNEETTDADDNVEAYDSNANCWFSLPSLKTPSSHWQLAATDNFLVAAGEHGLECLEFVVIQDAS